MNLEIFTKDENVLNVYIFGSHVYQTNHSLSDTDVILVVNSYFESNDINIHVYTKEQFQNKLNQGDIQMLECYFTPKQFVLKESYQFVLDLNKESLRISISTICSNSWVKGKKKLTISGDCDENLALKSIFHSLRILDFGIQISENQKIYNFSSMNFVLEDIKKISMEYKMNDLWNVIDVKYRKLYNEKSSYFKSLNPIEKDNQKKEFLNQILLKHGIKNESLLNDILNYIKK